MILDVSGQIPPKLNYKNSCLNSQKCDYNMGGNYIEYNTVGLVSQDLYKNMLELIE